MDKENQITRLNNQLVADSLNYQRLELQLKEIEILKGKDSDIVKKF